MLLSRITANLFFEELFRHGRGYLLRREGSCPTSFPGMDLTRIHVAEKVVLSYILPREVSLFDISSAYMLLLSVHYAAGSGCIGVSLICQASSCLNLSGYLKEQQCPDNASLLTMCRMDVSNNVVHICWIFQTLLKNNHPVTLTLHLVECVFVWYTFDCMFMHFSYAWNLCWCYCSAGIGFHSCRWSGVKFCRWVHG